MKKTLFISLMLILSLPVFGQGVLTYSGIDNYTLVERTNLRRYDNGKYTGLLSREVRSFLIQDMNRNGDLYYSGDFYVSQDTVKNQKVMVTGIHDAIPSSFIINEYGNVSMREDNGYPSFRSFPSFPRDPVGTGATWRGDSMRAVDPLNNGTVTKIPMTVQYKLLGRENYKGEEVYRISAEWATRYGISYWDFGGDRNLKSAQGSHKAVVLVSVYTGAAVFMTDSVDETFVYNDGTSVQYKGTILQFTEYPPSVPHEDIIPALKRLGAVAVAGTREPAASGFGGTTSGSSATGGGPASGGGGTSGGGSPSSGGTTSGGGSASSAGGALSGGSATSGSLASAGGTAASGETSSGGGPASGGGTASGGGSASKNQISEKISEAVSSSPDLGEKKITVAETDAGIRLSIHDLKFKPDSDELMPGENSRLDEIAAVLKLVKDNMFLVEGHTADTGYPEGEMKVSKARSRKIAEELAKRGIDTNRFICKGWGALKPAADNSTPEGKAINRRVEITILESR